ncbi:hypothetical protein BH18ACT10_BH18ACT10_18520 [soil metagenome]|nr:hypothetical protein [Rubrobacter sp.]
MDTSTSGKPSVGWAARFAYAAGATGILANPFFIVNVPERAMNIEQTLALWLRRKAAV